MQLTKSLFVAGAQCHKLLWWKVHEPLATELQPDKVLQDRFDQGAQVGELARREFPGGGMIDWETTAIGERASATDGRGAAPREAMAAGAGAVFEATFEDDGGRVKVDVVSRDKIQDARPKTQDPSVWRPIRV